MMTRKSKIDMIRGILKGTRSAAELRPARFAIAHTDPITGELTARKPYGSGQDDESYQRNEQLLKQAETDPSITVIRIVYT